MPSPHTGVLTVISSNRWVVRAIVGVSLLDACVIFYSSERTDFGASERSSSARLGAAAAAVC